MSHTPGQWTKGKNYGAIISDQTDGKLYGEHVGDADARAQEVEAYGGYLIAESIAPQNMPIVAAAPEMLDTLKTIENDGNQVPPWLWDRIKTVIAKAEGKAQ